MSYYLTKIYDSQAKIFGITIDDSNRIFITTNNECIYIVDKDGCYIFGFIKDSMLQGIVYHNNRLYVVDSSNNSKIYVCSLIEDNISFLTISGYKISIQ